MSSLLKDGWFESRGIAPPNTSTLILPVLEMIEDPTSVLSVFFDTSLKSFVLLLDVQPGHSMYTNLSDDEQTEFLLKISVISDINDRRLTKYNTVISKETETADSFKTESELQQNINLDTVRYGSTEKAPPVTSFALFGGINATSFLSILKNKAIGQNRPESAQVLVVVDYLRTEIMRYNYQIGVIVMPRISGSIPMAANTFITWDIVAEQIASVLQIVIKQKSIPFDLQ